MAPQREIEAHIRRRVYIDAWGNRYRLRYSYRVGGFRRAYLRVGSILLRVKAQVRGYTRWTFATHYRES